MPFYNDSSSEIKKVTKSSKFYEKSEIRLGSFIIDNENINNSNNVINNNNISINNFNNIKNYNEENNNLSIITNKDKDKISIKDFNEEFFGNMDNNNLDGNKILIDKNSFIINKNNNISDNFFNSEIQNIEQDIDTNISKSFTENENKFLNDKNNNENYKNYKNEKKNNLNNNLIISKEVNISIPNFINKDIKNILSSPKIPFNNNYNYEERYKNIECKSNRLIPKYKKILKNNIISNRSDYTKNKNRISFDLFQDDYNKINNRIENRNKRLSNIYNNTKNKIGNKKENIQTPSTYAKSCKNSLSTLTISEKNLLLSIKDNNSKNNNLTKNNNGSIIDDFFYNRYSLSNLNSINSLNKNLYNNYKIKKKRLNSICLNENIINKEIPNSNIKTDIDRYSTMKEKSNKFKFKNSFENNILNFNNSNEDFNKNFIKINSIQKCKEKRNVFNKNKLILKEKENINYNNTISNTLFKIKNIDTLLDSYLINKKSKIKYNNNICFTNNYDNNKLLVQKSYLSPKNIVNNKTKEFIQFKYLTKNIISKKEIEKYFKNIFNYITKNHEYLDVFKSMNTKTIPLEIYKPVHYVIKQCNNKERFISVNEFIQKGYEQFRFLSRNDKISIMNFNIFS